MWSRVCREDETPAVAALVWREVPAGMKHQPMVKAAPAAAPAEEQMARLQREIEQKMREAHAAGIREGDAAGHARAMAELQPVLARLAKSIEETAAVRTRLRSEAEADLVKLSLAIAKRVLRREIATDPEALYGLILGALKKLEGQEVSRVRVHPAHAAAVTACLRESHRPGTVEVTPDPSCALGSIVFEAARGNLDAGVETQLQEIERGLADRLRRQA
jgi:flagellar assembly protein FliH